MGYFNSRLRDGQRLRARGGGVFPTMPSSPSKTFDFMAETLDADLTFARTTAGTYKNSASKWVSAASGAQRWHYHTASLVGLLIEPTVTNRMTDNNANPTTTSGWTKSGDAAATLTVVTDPSTLLSDAGLDLLCTSGKVYKLDNSAGVAAAYADSVGTFGSTSGSTVSAWISGGSGTITRTGAGTPETLAFTASSPMVRRALSTTPNATTDTFRIAADAGQIVYFILAQIEVVAFKEWYDDGTGYSYRAIPTSPIVTTGATATRNNDALSVASLNSKTWFDEQNFTVAVEYIPYGYAGSQHLFNINAGNNQNEYAVEIRGVGTSGGYLRPRVRGNNIVDANQDLIVLGKPLIGKVNRTAFSASPTNYANVSPVIVFPLSVMPFTQRPNAPTTMRIGSNAAGSSSQFFGVIRKINIYKTAKTSEQMGADVLTSAQNIVMLAGQSLAESWVYSYETNHQNTGELKAIQVMDGYYPSNENIIMNGARGSSMLILGEYTGGLPYYFDDGGVAGGFSDWGDAGLRFVQQLNMVKAAGNTLKAIVWNQGQGGLGGTVTKARHKAGLVTLHQKIEEILGYEVPFIFEPLSRYSDAQAIRECYQELDADSNYPRMYQGPEVIDMILLADNTHPSSAGMYITVPRTMRKVMSVLGNTVTGGVDGPSYVSAIRSGTTVTFTFAHEDGTDFTPTTGIQGFIYLDGAAADVALSNVNRASATTITMTLASGVAGTLYWIYGSSITADITKYARDNSTNGLIIRSCAIAVA